MHTLWQRLNVMSTVALTVLGVMTSVLALSTWYFELWTGLPEPAIELEFDKIMQMYHNPRLDEELAAATFRLTADFKELWHWNVKVLFVYVLVEYEHNGKLSEVTIYDDALESPQVVSLGHTEPEIKYFLSGERGALLYVFFFFFKFFFFFFFIIVN